MKLQISQLKDGENPFQFDSERDGWVKDITHHVEKQGYRLLSRFKMDLNLTKLEPDYYLRGQLEFAIQQTCARCAEFFSLTISHPFTIALAHHNSTRVKASELSEIEEDELDVCFFEGTEIELAPIIEEQFFLSLPYQAVCRKGCAGICQQCGQNLNEKSCACRRSNRPVGPFSALEGLKLH